MNENFSFARYFDHTLLRADASEEEIRTLLAEAGEYGFAAICVNGCHVPLAAEYLAGTTVRVATVVGFPLGACAADAKSAEARIAIAQGADEIDMVMNIGAAKEGRWDAVEQEIATLAQICRQATEATNAPAGSEGASATDAPAGTGSRRPVLLKVILETCLLTDREIMQACRAARRAGADFVKTSTGFSSGGATVHAVRLMKKTVGTAMQVKASGGIRTLADARAMIAAGADRLGCSASVRIMEEHRAAGSNR